MNIDIKIKKGLDLHLVGAVDSPSISRLEAPSVVAVVPDDFPGLTLKPTVHEGDEVAVGSPLLRDKTNPEIMVVSPIAGKVKAIVRGERRKILRVEVENVATATEPVKFDTADARKALQNSGIWALMRQRPYDIVPKADCTVRDIYITGFDSAPLAVNRTEFDAPTVALMQKGVKLLSSLTGGKVYLSRRAEQNMPDIEGAVMLTVDGPHPAGNASTLIAATTPINKDETIITLDLATLMRVGTLVAEGRFDATAIVAVTGSEISKPQVVATTIGAPIALLLAGNLDKVEHHVRIISGNVLTGIKESADSYLRYPYRQVTVIPEGDDVDEFMGWASISPKKMSVSASFPGSFLRKKLFRPDARTLGGKRAMIQSGQFDSVMPLDILPEFLLKAIIARDLERMEQLGIYEVAPEDFALAEYVDISKMELQQIVADGIAFMRKELE